MGKFERYYASLQQGLRSVSSMRGEWHGASAVLFAKRRDQALYRSGTRSSDIVIRS
jgi:hypothetical protein